MKRLSMFVCAMLLFTSSYATRLDTYFQKSDALFKKYVKSGKVNYASLKTHIAEVDELLKMAEVMSLGADPNPRTKAFYINTYNLIVIHDLAKRYPISSPKAIPGFHSQKKHRVNNKYYTLDGLKAKVLSKFPDARICFALCDGAKGSPALASYAFKPDKLESQLDARTKKAINDANFVRIKPASEKVVVSEVFKKNISVFGGSKESVLVFIKKYLKEGTTIPEAYTLDYYPFDWHINK